MKDRAFKDLPHASGSFKTYSSGQQVENGYKPDFVLSSHAEFIILESEINSSRKLFVGTLIKAAHFLKDTRKGILVIVMHKKYNTTAIQIANHLIPYYQWIKDKTNLSNVYVIEAEDYCLESKPLEILGEKFIELAIKV
jgi:hypothetical protein